MNGENPVAYAYDDDGLVVQAGAMALTRDPATGFVTDTALGAVTTHYDYNDFGELESISASVSGTPILEMSYARDKLGRITTKSETVEGVASTYLYVYDSSGRLDSVTINGVLAADYGYDANGNRLTRMSPNGTEAGAYDDQDRLLSYSGADYTYTRNGETLSKSDPSGVTSFDYDLYGNLLGVELPNGTTLEYVVDARNRRIGTRTNGAWTQKLLWQGQLSPIAELDSANAVEARFVFATRPNVPDYIATGSSTFRVIHDHLGSPRLVVDTSTGSIVRRQDYDEWGFVQADSNPGVHPFAFAGGLEEVGSGRVRLGSRDYDPFSGRWLSKDSSGASGGDTNLFAYGVGDPISAPDVNGHYSLVLVGGVVVVGLVVTAVVLSNPQVQEGSRQAAEEISDWWSRQPPLVLPFPDAHRVREPVIYDEETQCPAGLDKPFPGWEPDVAPGEGWEWRGKPGSKPGDPEGAWFNPKAKESLRPDLGHGPPHGPHWDWKDPNGGWFRITPDGKVTPK